MGPFVISVRCDEMELSALRHELGEWLDGEDVPGEAAFPVKLVTHEAARNAIAHSDPRDSLIVRAIHEEDDILIEVVDSSAEPWELTADDGTEIRGLTLIHGLSRCVETVRSPGGSAVVMLLAAR